MERKIFMQKISYYSQIKGKTMACFSALRLSHELTS